ncbi:hydroxylysine kinase [Lingula anatina]|uniref:Hydroxylysine kinase n=1 Tax=Lingula anatina TaxID=7574 RepID=A0A1S3HWM7_LINAN|nr:hydroxylysine kinase [Lingula anatina]XP_013389956.1 hydroxylysine kinase [Lingula anatina]|eukprot:XP_013389955.1 hydroxylysine kinase [Lingula anatina]
MAERRPLERVVRPCITDTVAVRLVKTLYGLTTSSIHKLDGYDDQNFHVKVQPCSTNPFIPEVWPHGYVLKILNAIDSEEPEHVDGRTELLKHLNNKKIKVDGEIMQVPLPVQNIHGKYWSREKLHNQLEENNKDTKGVPYDYYIVRMFRFVLGTTLDQVPLTPAILFQTGKLCGEINKALEDFWHPSYEQWDSIWKLDNLPKLSEYVQKFDDERKRRIIFEVIDTFNTELLDSSMDITKGIVHGDINAQNILTRENLSGDDAEVTYSLCGFIDVEHSHNGCYAFEVAIGMAYMMIESKVIDPLLAGGHFLAGYLQVRQLTSKEMDILWICVAARLAQSLTFGWNGYLKDKSNAYFLITQESGWRVMDKFWSTNKNELYAKWKEVIASYNQ